MSSSVPEVLYQAVQNSERLRKAVWKFIVLEPASANGLSTEDWKRLTEWLQTQSH